jgi:RHS repeat-associated protein
VWGPDLGSRLEARRDWQTAGGVGGLLMTLYPMPSVNVPTYIEWLAGQGVYETTQIGYEDGNGGWVPYYGEYTGPFYDENNNWISEYGGYDSPYGFLTYSMATAYGLDYGYYAALYEVNHRLHVPVMDHMGNVTSVVRLLGSPGSGSSAQTEFLYDYDAFGKELRASALIAGSNPDSYPFRFSTKFTDTETGLVYYGYRFYDPANGRWINRDPIGENGGLNLYGMLGSDLINAYDLFGFAPVLDNPHTSDLQSGQKMLDLAKVTEGNGPFSEVGRQAAAEGLRTAQSHLRKEAAKRALERLAQEGAKRMHGRDFYEEDVKRYENAKYEGAGDEDFDRKDRCQRTHASYKQTEKDRKNYTDGKPFLGPLTQKLQKPGCDRDDLCAKLSQYINDLERETLSRGSYINDGCDEWDWNNEGQGEAARRKNHEDQLAGKNAALGKAKAAAKKYCK